MKTIVLIRHAKSSWEFTELDDFERPLIKRGKSDARTMGKVLRKIKLFPELIISSPSVRTMSTAKLIAKETSYSSGRIISEQLLYHGGCRDIKKVLAFIDDTIETVFVIGHNPGLTEMACLLTNKPIDNIPTAAIFGIQWEVDCWSKTLSTLGKNIFFEKAKKHRT